MPLYIHDTLKREKRVFKPQNPARVTMYVCGPTVYSYAHIGNARPVVVFDVLFRLLRRLYGDDHVIYARNITDVDDRINKAAMDQGVDISVVTGKFEAIYNEDMATLGALPPTLTPHATDHMAPMSAIIERLVANDMAYIADGEILFDVAAYEAKGGQYGALSGRSLDDMVAGARVEVADNKRNPADFVLWKPSKPGEPEWDGPQGLKGRPGWHIECSAMIEANLGLPIDIHGGGHDLIFPHHTNEIAQSCAAHGSTEASDYARYWMHNGFLDFSGEKMSKSLGNVVLVHDMVKHYPGEVIRWALLSGHYRSPLDWTPDLLEQSQKNLDRLYQVLLDATRLLGDPSDADGNDAGRSPSASYETLVSALCDDLNTPAAIAALFEIATHIRSAISQGRDADARLWRDKLLAGAELLGVLRQDPRAWFKSGADDALTSKVEALIAERAAARAAKNWPEADRIRDALNALNVEVMDGPTGATWKMKGAA
jgi:cysteinyl-tRNA synthetase